MRIKAPTFKRTHEYFKRLAEYISFGTIASRCGKETQTAEAWGRVPESVDNPNGTGKANPTDVQLRLLGMAHKENPGLAREWAMVFPDYVDYLDGEKAVESLHNISLAEIAAVAMKETSEAVVEAIRGRDYSKAWTEYVQAQCAMRELEVTLKGKLREPELKQAA